MKHIRVLIAEDSKMLCEILKSILSNNENINIIGTVNNGVDAYRFIQSMEPDFLIMEMNLPLMDGIKLLEMIKEENINIDVLVMASFPDNDELGKKALDLGASDIVYKPKNISIDFLKDQILNKIIASFDKDSNLHVLNKSDKIKKNSAIKRKLYRQEEYASNFDDKVKILPYDQKQVAIAINKALKIDFAYPKIVAIGISTGGPRALRILLPSLPENFPLPVLIAQHIPKDFSASLISSLQDICKIKIKEAVLDEEVLPSTVYISPGDKNIAVYLDYAGKLRIKFYQDYENKYIYTPSIDHLFDTINDVIVNKAIAIVMTGMGNDGTEGMKKLYNNGNLTIAQNEDTCTVYGMPRNVIENHAAHLVLSLYDIAEFLIQYIKVKEE